jgi:methylated-DNA-[protein]-cysteine S-methyltransferase
MMTRNDRTHVVIGSPYGPLTLVASRDHLVGLYMEGQRHRPDDYFFGNRLAGPETEPFIEAVRQLGEYFRRDRKRFDLPISAAGTQFQQRVWAGLREIPYGETWTYSELAEFIGEPTSARAVGLANGKNPIGIIVPCHRVIGSDGSLTGYGGGLDRKRALLEHEGALPSALTIFQRDFAPAHQGDGSADTGLRVGTSRQP